MTTVDALGNRISASFDVRGRRSQLNDPDAGVITYCHDALGQLKAQQNSQMRGSHPSAPPTVLPAMKCLCKRYATLRT
jgi:hypothetical protein